MSDGTNNVSKDMSIAVLNEQEEPTASDQEFIIDENSPAGTLVGTIVAKEPDNQPLEYWILDGNEEGTFALDSTSGELTVADSILLDFEENDLLELFVEASDNTGLSVEISVTILLNDLDETGPEEVLSIDPSMGRTGGLPQPDFVVF